MSGPIVRIDGSEEIQDSGTTLGDLRETYPGCYLVNGNKAHRSSAFVLENGVTYDLKLPSSALEIARLKEENALKEEQKALEIARLMEENAALKEQASAAVPLTREQLFAFDSMATSSIPESLNDKTVNKPDWLKIELPRRIDQSHEASLVDLTLPLETNPFFKNMNKKNVERLLELTNLQKGYNHVLLLGCSGGGKTSACLALCSRRFAVYLECTDMNSLQDDAAGYRFDRSTWTKGFGYQREVTYAFNMEVAARLVVLGHLLEHMGADLTPQKWLLYFLSKNGADRIGSVFKSIKKSGGVVTTDVLIELLSQVNVVIQSKHPQVPSLVVAVDELQKLGTGRVRKSKGSIINDETDISVMRSVVEAACCVPASAVWSGTRMSITKSLSGTTAFAKMLSGERQLLAIGDFDYLTPEQVSVLLNQVLVLDNVPPQIKDQLYHGLQGRARTCAGFVSYLLSPHCLDAIKGPLDESIEGFYTSFMKDMVYKRVKKDVKMLFNDPTTTSNIGQLWYHTMLSSVNNLPKTDQCFKQYSLAFTESVTMVDSDTVSSSSSSESSEERVNYQYVQRFTEPSMQESMLQLARENPHYADFGVQRMLSEALTSSARGAYLDYAVGLSLLYRSKDFMMSMCNNTSFDEFKDYSLSLDRLVCTVTVDQQLEWFEKILKNPDDCSFSLLPGIKVKNIAILPSVLSGADLICAATRMTSIAGQQTKKQKTCNIVFLHVCCANYTKGVTMKKHKDQKAKSGKQFTKLSRKSIATTNYRKVASKQALNYAVIPILVEIPQNMELEDGDDYLLITQKLNTEKLFCQSAVNVLTEDNCEL